MVPRYQHSASTANPWSRRARRSQSHGRHFVRLISKRVGSQVVALCCRMLLLLAMHIRHYGKRNHTIQNKIRPGFHWTYHSSGSGSQFQAYVRQKYCKDPQVWRHIFLGYSQQAGGGWSGDLIIADWEEIETAESCHEIYPRRLRAKEVFPIMHGKAKGSFSFPLAEGRLTQPGTCRFKNRSRRGVEAPLEHDDGVKDIPTSQS